MTFAEYLYEKHIDPFEIAFKSEQDLKELKNEWKNIEGNSEKIDDVFDKLSSLNLKVDNKKLVSVVSKMTKGDKKQTNLVGSWVYFCLTGNKSSAIKAKEKVSTNYQTIMTKYLDSFIKMLRN